MRNAKAIVKKFIKKMSRTFLQAFEMGYADGKEGKMMKFNKLPPKEDNARVYALCLIAQELYNDGFKAGTVVRRHDGSV